MKMSTRLSAAHCSYFNFLFSSDLLFLLLLLLLQLRQMAAAFCLVHVPEVTKVGCAFPSVSRHSLGTALMSCGWL